MAESSQSQTLGGQVQAICSSTSPEDRRAAINTLVKIVQNALDNPDVEQYRKIRMENTSFKQRVWRHPTAQQFLFSVGWVVVEDILVLPSDDLLQQALIELVKAKSTLEEEQAGWDSGLQEPPEASGSNNIEYRERQKKLLEAQRKVKEERKKIVEQITSDRQETEKREAKSSHGRELKFGANLNRFEDIGVDLNAGGG